MNQIGKNKMNTNLGTDINKDVLWHSLTVSEVFAKLSTGKNGLITSEVQKRSKIYGANQLLTYKRESLLMRFLRQFHNILIYILLVSGIIALFLERFVDASVIFVVIVLNAIFGFIQEGKAEKALEAIRNMLAPMANVIRDRTRVTIHTSGLVPGDIVLIQSGDKIPADLRIVESKSLQVQEASLTGESTPVDKFSKPVEENTPLAERGSMAYSGTIATYGKGMGVVVGTAAKTEIGKISAFLAKRPVITTPLLEKLNKLGWWLSFAIIVMALGTFLVGALVWGDSSGEMFMAIVGLTVAAIPEGLPPVMTIILAIGVTRMAKRNAIVRRLPAVETMGSVTTICTDKTGTLTCNELAVQSIATSRNQYTISGGATLSGEFYIDDDIIKPEGHPDLQKALRGAVLCNDAELVSSEGAEGTQWVLHGDPLDGALLMLSHKAKIDYHLENKNYPRTDLIPYESQHKFMATLHHDHMGRAYIYIKGAAEKILEICSFQQSNGELEKLGFSYWNDCIYKFAANGQKVVAVAYKEVSPEMRNLSFNDVQDGLIFLTIFGLIDPPREEAAAAVAECQAAGIRIKMITGDHAATAKAIALSLGIGVNSAEQSCADFDVITGQQIDAMSDAELQKVAEKVDVYARTSPEHKLRLVQALRARGEIVAMTGDGVNDAPALSQADIGIAMGHKGTEIAKEASAMVLADDNFATIVHAVEEGRTIYNNLKKAILFILPTSFAQAFIMMIAILVGWQTPLTAVQILWVNMVTAVTLSLSLGFEPTDPSLMREAPRPSNEPILSPFLVWRTVFVSLLFVVGAFGLSEIERRIGADLQTMRTEVVNFMVCAEVAYLINCRNIYRSILNKYLLILSRPMLVAIVSVVALQLLFDYAPPMQYFFKISPLSLFQWARILGSSVLVLLLVEAEKVLMRVWSWKFAEK